MDNNDLQEEVMGNMVRALTILQGCREFSSLMPEVRVNLVYALPGARTPQDVAAIDGRITVVQGLPHASGLPSWGASDHMARLIIESRRYDASINAGINFKCDSGIIEVVRSYCAGKNYTFGMIDRTVEPAEVTARDGASMPWKIKQLVDSSGGMPRLFYEGDGWGKEPLFVAVGSDAMDVTAIAIDIARLYRERNK
jgi:hydroxymethylpyrimidine/phosphomethylpyrimidine kinase